MFDEITVETKPWTFAASMSLQSILVAAALVLPLLHIARIETRMPMGLIIPRPINAPPEIRQVASNSGTASAALLTHPVRTYRPFQAPSHIPVHIAMGPDLPDAPIYNIGIAGGGGASGVETGIPGLALGPAIVIQPPEPKRPAAAPAAHPAVAPLTVGGKVQAAKLIFAPKPVYPPLAKSARISGTVKLAARIAEDGHIRDLRVITGHPMLLQSAIEAVRQWIYQPTLLNGVPVEVLTDIEVNFLLQ